MNLPWRRNVAGSDQQVGRIKSEGLCKLSIRVAMLSGALVLFPALRYPAMATLFAALS